MRAATVIVGAIAISSCLIALALVLSGGNNSPERVVEPAREGSQARSPTKSPSGGEGGPASIPGPTECGGELSVEGVSCEVGKSVRAAYGSGGGEAVTVSVKDPETGKTVTFNCTGSAPTQCSGPGGVNIFWP